MRDERVRLSRGELGRRRLAGERSLNRSWISRVLPVASLFVASTASAHGLGFSDLELRVEGRRIAGEWKVQRPDARLFLSEGALAAPDAVNGELADYLTHHLSVRANGVACAPASEVARAAPSTDLQSPYAVPVSYRCPSPPVDVEIDCDLLFDRQPKHRAYFSLEDERTTHLGVFREDQRTVNIHVRAFHFLEGFVEFAR